MKLSFISPSFRSESVDCLNRTQRWIDFYQTPKQLPNLDPIKNPWLHSVRARVYPENKVQYLKIQAG